MRKYELVIVFRPSIPEAQVKEQIQKIREQVSGQSTTLDSVKSDVWGRKEIGYLKGRTRTGTYVQLSFESNESSIVDRVTSLLRINETLQKFQFHRVNEKVRKFKGNPKRKSSGEIDLDDYSSDMDLY